VGVNVATKPLYVTVPATADPPVAVSVKVVALIVEGVIASLKVALNTWLIGIFTAPFAGAVDTTTDGGVIVVKDHA
jgi:hypothetical protein